MKEEKHTSILDKSNAHIHVAKFAKVLELHKNKQYKAGLGIYTDVYTALFCHQLCMSDTLVGPGWNETS